MLLRDCVSSWIETRSVSKPLAPSTVSGYRGLYRLYVAPSAAGGKELHELIDLDMIELLRPLIDRGCTRQAQILQTLVSAALRQAVRKHLLSWSPMDEIDRINHRSRVTPWLTPDQARQLLTSSAAADDPYYIAWVLMMCCGLRRGEMLALRGSDIDVARGELHVVRQMIVVNRTALITRPKSLGSCRDIPLDDDLLSLLRLHCRSSGRILDGVTRSMLADALQRALDRAQLPRVTLHGLRHTMAAAAADGGVPVKVLQSLMGHAHYQTTADIYAHVDQLPRIAAARLISHTLLPARLEIV